MVSCAGMLTAAGLVLAREMTSGWSVTGWRVMAPTAASEPSASLIFVGVSDRTSMGVSLSMIERLVVPPVKPVAFARMVQERTGSMVVLSEASKLKLAEAELAG